MKDRRRHARQPVRSLVYVKLGPDNGGVVLNVSEGGLVARAANVMTGDDLSRVCFQVPRTKNHLEIGGQVVWISESKKEAGVRFLDVTDDARLQLSQWIASEASAAELQRWREIFSAAVQSSSHSPAAAKPSVATPKPAKPSPVPTSEVRAVEPKASVRDSLPGAANSQRAKDALPAQKWQKVLSLANQRPSAMQTAGHASASASPSPATTPKPAPPDPIIPAAKDAPVRVPNEFPGVKAAASQVPQQISAASELIAELPDLGTPSPAVEPQDQQSADVPSPEPTISAEKSASRPEPERSTLSWKSERKQIRLWWVLAGISVVLAVLFLSLRRTTPAPGVTYAPPATATTTDEAGVNSPELLQSSDAPVGARHENPVHLVVTGRAVRPRRSKTKFQVTALAPPSSPHRANVDESPDNDIVSVPVNPSNDSSAASSSMLTLAPSAPVLAPPAPRPLRSPQQKLLEPAYLLYRVEPAYPPDAAEQRIEGTVRLRAFVGKDGRVHKVELVSGPPLLVQAAMNAARDWRYIPAILNGQPVENEEEISIDFHLPR